MGGDNRSGGATDARLLARRRRFIIVLALLSATAAACFLLYLSRFPFCNWMYNHDMWLFVLVFCA